MAAKKAKSVEQAVVNSVETVERSITYKQTGRSVEFFDGDTVIAKVEAALFAPVSESWVARQIAEIEQKS